MPLSVRSNLGNCSFRGWQLRRMSMYSRRCRWISGPMFFCSSLGSSKVSSRSPSVSSTLEMISTREAMSELSRKTRRSPIVFSRMPSRLLLMAWWTESKRPLFRSVKVMIVLCIPRFWRRVGASGCLSRRRCATQIPWPGARSAHRWSVR